MTSGSSNLTLRRGTRHWRCVGLLATGRVQWLTVLGLKRKWSDIVWELRGKKAERRFDEGRAS